MSEKELMDKVAQAIVNLDFDGIQGICKQALDAKIPAYRIVSEAMAKGMDIVGKKYEANEYFLSELIAAGEVMKDGLKVLQPHLRSGDVKKKGKVALGTVKGDLHDIGKNVVSVLLEAAGFEIIDLGVDVPAEKFVEVVKDQKPQIIGMSALLTITMPEMETAIKQLKQLGLKDKVKVIIGGAPITPEYAKKIGADAAAKDAVDGVNICKGWVGA